MCVVLAKQRYNAENRTAGKKYRGPVEHEDNCQCTEEDYKWYVLISHLLPRIRTNLYFASDYNFVRNGKDCIPVGLELIPDEVCTGNRDQTYKSSTGWMKVLGNTCVDGIKSLQGILFVIVGLKHF